MSKKKLAELEFSTASDVIAASAAAGDDVLRSRQILSESPNFSHSNFFLS